MMIRVQVRIAIHMDVMAVMMMEERRDAIVQGLECDVITKQQNNRIRTESRE